MLERCQERTDLGAGSGTRSSDTATRADDDQRAFCQALALGMDRGNAAVRRRLVDLGRFLDLSDGDDSEMERQARGLGLVESDPVIRRHVSNLGRLAFGKLDPTNLPTEEELREYYAAHAADFPTPEVLRLTHVFVSPERNAGQTAGRAAELLEVLRTGVRAASEGPALGDPFLAAPASLTASTVELDRVFGNGFGSSLASAPEGVWTGPFVSAYGRHLVWVHERKASSPSPYAAVRSKILHRVIRERSEAQRRARMTEIRARHANVPTSG